jgi:hypothetical protein
MSDVIAQIFMSAAKEAGKVKIAELLAKIKEHNTPEVYEQALKAGSSFFNLLGDLAKKSKTKLDDYAIGIFLEPIEDAADDDDIDL